MININLNLSKLPKAVMLKGKDDCMYINLTCTEMRKPDNQGNTHTVYVAQSKKERDSQAPKIYVGKARQIIFEKRPTPQEYENVEIIDAANDLPF